MKHSCIDTRSVERPAQRPPLVKPRRQLGPDALTALRGFSLSQTGNRHTFDGCRIQRSIGGSISWNLDPESMDFLGYEHEDTYGHLIRRDLIPAAERLEAHLSSVSNTERIAELNRMLQKAAQGDGLAFWLLSTRSLRRMLFPAAYDPITGKRRDNVIYHYAAKDFRHAGKVILLRGLDDPSVRHFTDQALKLTNNFINIYHATPVTLQ